MDLKDLLDREAIRQVLYRYCRGVDRGDEGVLRGAYWPDGTDNHGAYPEAPTALSLSRSRPSAPPSPASIQMHNILIDFDGDDVAHVETYFSAWQELPTPNGLVRAHQKGRYVDRFEKRDAEWRIKDRLVVFDWTETLPEPELSLEERKARVRTVGGHHPDDPVYTTRT